MAVPHPGAPSATRNEPYLNDQHHHDSPKALHPDTTFAASEIIPDALILQATIVAGEVEGDEPAVRVAYVQADPTAGFVPEGTEIDPADADLAEVIVQTGKVAVLSKLSNEASKSAAARPS